MARTKTPAKPTATDNLNAVHRALPANGEWSTAQAVADATALAYSTVTPLLRKLAEDGSAESTKDGRVMVWRQLTPGAKLTASDVPTPRAKTKPPRNVGVGRVSLESGDPATERASRNAQRRGKARRDRAGKPAEGAVEASTPEVATEVATATRAPRAGSVAAVVAGMEAARPVSPAPVGSDRPKRTRSANGTKPSYARWGLGELRDAVLRHLRTLAEGVDASPGEIAKALNGQAAPVATNLARMCKAGVVEQTSDAPKRYRAA